MSVAVRFAFCAFLPLLMTSGHAQLFYTDLDFGAKYLQTGTAATLQAPVIAADLDGYGETGGAVVSLTTPAGTILNLTEINPAYWQVVSMLGSVSNVYPNGTYTLKASGGALGTQTIHFSANKSYPVDDLFTGNSFSNLSTSAVTSPITVTFSAFTPDPSAEESYLDLEIPSLGFNMDLNPTATSYTFAANTFKPGTTYEIDLQGSNFYADASLNNGVDYATNNYLQFTTESVPEPSSIGYVLICLMVIGLIRHSSRRQTR